MDVKQTKISSCKKAGASVVVMSTHDHRQLEKSKEIGDVDIYFEDSDKD